MTNTCFHTSQHYRPLFSCLCHQIQDRCESVLLISPSWRDWVSDTLFTLFGIDSRKVWSGLSEFFKKHKCAYYWSRVMAGIQKKNVLDIHLRSFRMESWNRLRPTEISLPTLWRCSNLWVHSDGWSIKVLTRKQNSLWTGLMPQTNFLFLLDVLSRDIYLVF